MASQFRAALRWWSSKCGTSRRSPLAMENKQIRRINGVGFSGSSGTARAQKLLGLRATLLAQADRQASRTRPRFVVGGRGDEGSVSCGGSRGCAAQRAAISARTRLRRSSARSLFCFRERRGGSIVSESAGVWGGDGAARGALCCLRGFVVRTNVFCARLGVTSSAATPAARKRFALRLRRRMAYFWAFSWSARQSEGPFIVVATWSAPAAAELRVVAKKTPSVALVIVMVACNKASVRSAMARTWGGGTDGTSQVLGSR